MATLNALTNEELLRTLHLLCADERKLLARVLLLLIEVEERRLHLASACSSMFDFCVRKLRMSENQSARRIAAARLVRKFPALLPHIETGELQLTSLLLLREHLTPENHEELIAEARGRNKFEIALLLARRAPAPDVPPTLMAMDAQAGDTSRGQHSPGEPLSPGRFAVQFTASEELREKIRRAQDMSRHTNPSGDLAVLFEGALDLLLATLEKRHHGKSLRPLKKARPAAPDRVTNEIRREVTERDGERCTFVDAEGNRCPSRGFLQYDHVHSKALGGATTPTNIRILCGPHNRYEAERALGREYVEQRREARQDKASRRKAKGAKVSPSPATVKKASPRSAPITASHRPRSRERRQKESR